MTAFEYLVHASWATYALQAGKSRIEWSADRLSGDAFGEFLKALAASLKGRQDEVTTDFIDAPHCLKVSLVSQGDSVRVRAVRYRDWPGKGDGDLVFDEVVRLRTLAGSVLSCAQAVLERESAASYEAKLGTPFPKEAIASLQAALA